MNKKHYHSVAKQHSTIAECDNVLCACCWHLMQCEAVSPPHCVLRLIIKVKPVPVKVTAARNAKPL